MKATTMLVIIAVLSIMASSVPLQVVSNIQTTSNSQNLAVNTNQNFWLGSQNSVLYQFGQVTVPKELYYIGLNGVAYKQLTSLYPTYKTYNINKCSYTVYGPSRIYLYVLSNSVASVQLVSAVQNSEQTTGQQTQETVQQETAATNEATSQASTNNNQVTSYSIIKLSRAYEIPRVVLAVKQVTRENWSKIRSAPLVRCLQRWEQGVYNFRLYFDGIPNWFEYSRISNYVTASSELQSASNIVSNLPIRSQLTSQVVDQITLSNPQQSTDPNYLPLRAPIFGVNQVDAYLSYDLPSFRRHAGYNTIIAQYTNYFGKFDDSWINKISHKYDNHTDYFQITVKFAPFMQNCDSEVHYYGSIDKAALLNIDQRVFNSAQHKVDEYEEVKDFKSYNQFKASHQYVLSQFTYLRLYEVVAAYSAIHKGGLYVRLVYLQNSTQNQFNIVVYKCDGQYYIDRNDFLATNLDSYGRTNWVSLFVPITNFNAYSSFNRIVKYFKSIHPQFWDNNMVKAINLKDNLNVIQFKNPTSNASNYCVLDIKNDSIIEVNHFNWTLVSLTSPFYAKAFSYVSSKYNVSSQMFIYFKSDPFGQHYEVSYLNNQEVFCNARLRWLPTNAVFTQDQSVNVYGIDAAVVPLPTNPSTSLITFITSQDADIISVVSVQTVSQTSYSCVALSQTNRWNYNVDWVHGNWIVQKKTPVIDGYFRVSGFPGVNTASCTGYLTKIYPTAFTKKYLYTFIEVKNIGYFVYNRISYNINGLGYQAIVRTTYGVQNSHTLISWDQSSYCKNLKDYGYGVDYSFNYGYEDKYFFDMPVILSASVSSSVTVINTQSTITVVTLDQTDLLCSYWSGSTCLSCYGDYYASQGKCVKIQSTCQYWTEKGLCLTCSYGWSVNVDGQCAQKVVNKITFGL